MVTFFTPEISNISPGGGPLGEFTSLPRGPSETNHFLIGGNGIPLSQEEVRHLLLFQRCHYLTSLLLWKCTLRSSANAHKIDEWPTWVYFLNARDLSFKWREPKPHLSLCL
ncbi:hypothetical protein CDAR_520131 [Caerostris darwini]|uniref:Uncharacterized protein n=1 Tax=Caerostris darwini TaxID=1538125 RepID=A0AAV4TSE6_9ARAC|nr:hypothetical protein CDAR_520131 [Caerostris darwini]